MTEAGTFQRGITPFLAPPTDVGIPIAPPIALMLFCAGRCADVVKNSRSVSLLELRTLA